MAQLRHDYDKFSALDTQIIVMVPNGPRMIERYVREAAPPYPILTDMGAAVAQRYGVDTKGPAFMKLFESAVFLVDRAGRIAYANYLPSFLKEPDNGEVLRVLEAGADGHASP